MRHVYAISWDEPIGSTGEIRPGQRSLVTIDDKQPDIVFWGTGPSRCTRSHFLNMVILKEYDPHSAVHHAYARDFPPEPWDMTTADNLRVAGMLSPEGHLYDCEYSGHTSLCYDLVYAFYDEADDDMLEPTERLFADGWIRLSDMGNWSKGDNLALPTTAQINFLIALANANSVDERYAKNIRYCMRYFEL